MEMHVFKKVCLFLFLVLGVQAKAQQVTPPLERKVTIEFKGESTKQALKKLEDTGGYTFAFRTDLVNANNQLSRTYIEKSTREILDDLFQGEIVYKVKGNYIILRDAPDLKNEEVLIEGYVIDDITGDKVPFVSIYDSVTLNSTISDEYGYYSLTFSRKEEVRLVATKVGYHDTIVSHDSSGKKVLNFYIRPLTIADSTVIYQDTSSFIDRLKGIKLFRPSEEQRQHLQNLKNNLQRTAQFSIVPGVGTNGRMSSSTTVDYSFNLIGGFNGGVRKLELGGLFNVTWDSVSYIQMAGLFNTVGGPLTGVQFSGLANLNNSTVEGGQFSGFLNVARRQVNGGQFAGFTNVAAGGVSGIQTAGFWNTSGDSSELIQLAGFGNLLRNNSEGVQGSGFINVAGRNFTGYQFAGFANVSMGSMTGVQTAGFINVAKEINGVQIGVFNFNDSIDGVSLGFFNYSRKGYHNLEVSANELFPLNLAFRTGTHQFYNIFSSGLRFGIGDPFWTYGYGIGSSVKTGSKSRLFFDLQANQVHLGSQDMKLNMVNKLAVTYHVQLKPKVALAVGPTLNMSLSDQSQLINSNVEALVPYSFEEISYSSLNLRSQFWVGGQVALRLF